jgi:O-antigen/teichoic acid export membrane protein
MSLFKKLLTSDKRVSIDLLFLWSSQLLCALIAFLTQLILVRLLSVSEYGILSFSLTTVTVISTIAGFGIGAFLLRVFGMEGWGAYRWVRSLKSIWMVSVAVSIIIVFFFVLIEQNKKIDILLLLFISIIILQGITTISFAINQLEERFITFAIFKLLNQGYKFVVVILLYFIGVNLYKVGIGYSLGAIFVIILSLPSIIKFFNKKIDLKGHSIPSELPSKKSKTMAETYNELWPYAFASISYLIYNQSDVVILGFFESNYIVGIYSVAYTALTVIYLFPSTLYQSYLLPKIHRWIEKDPEKLFSLFLSGNKIMLVVSLSIMCIVFLGSKTLIPILFGHKYLFSAEVLMVLSFAIPFRFLAISFGSLLVTRNTMKKKFFYQLPGTAINIIINLTCIPIIGIWGAVVSTIVTEFVLFVLFLVGVNKYVLTGEGHLAKLVKPLLLPLVCTYAILLAILYFFI